MKRSPFMGLLPLGYALLFASSPSFFSSNLKVLVAAQEESHDEGHEDQENDEANVMGEDHEEGELHHDAYDPLNENEFNPCRRHPTWWWGGGGDSGTTAVDYETCQELTGWSPRDSWWRFDTEPMREWLSNEKEELIAECLDAAFLSVPETFWWAA
jgi:hypothetical protein